MQEPYKSSFKFSEMLKTMRDNKFKQAYTYINPFGLSIAYCMLSQFPSLLSPIFLFLTYKYRDFVSIRVKKCGDHLPRL